MILHRSTENEGIWLSNEHDMPNFPPRISVLNENGETLARIGNRWGTEPGQSMVTHDLCLDSNHKLYMSDASPYVLSLTGETVPDDWHGLYTFVKAS